MSNADIPSGEYSDNDYKSRTGQSEIPVVSDGDVTNNDVANPDSDEQLGMLSSFFELQFRMLMFRSQPEMIPTLLMRVTSSTQRLVVLSHLEATQSLAMRRVYHRMMAQAQLLSRCSWTCDNSGFHRSEYN